MRGQITLKKLTDDYGTMTYCLVPNKHYEYLDLLEIYVPNGCSETDTESGVYYTFYI